MHTDSRRFSDFVSGETFASKWAHKLVTPVPAWSQSRAFGLGLMVALSVVSIVAVGYLDVLTGNASVAVLYLVPICICTWMVGRPAGLGLACVSALTALRADLTVRSDLGHPWLEQGHPIVPYWNAATLLVISAAAVVLLYALQQSKATLASKVEERTAELTKTNRELRATQLKLVEAAKLEMVGRLAAGIVHEVKNPLATITMAAGCLAEVVPPDQAESQKIISCMSEAAARANRVVSELLELSRPSSLQVKSESLHDTLLHALGLLRLQLSERRVSVARRFDLANPVLALDKNKMIQVFLNLLVNAIHAMPDGGTVVVSTRSSDVSSAMGSAAVVEIDDAGSGISAENLHKLFEPFFTTKTNGQGTGLGLMVSRQIVQQHGGTFTLANRAEGGVRATITLPPSN